VSNRNEVEVQFLDYKNIEDQDELNNLGIEMAVALAGLGEQYLRLDGVVLGHEFYQRLGRALKKNATTRRSYAVIDIHFNEILFNLSGELKYRKKMKELAKDIGTTGVTARPESDNENFELFKWAVTWVSLLEPLPVSSPFDFRKVFLELNLLEATSKGNHPEINLAMWMNLGDHLSEEYRHSGSPNHKTMALEVYKKVTKILDELKDIDTDYYSDWGVALANQSEFMADVSLGYAAQEKCHQSWNAVATNGYMDWMYAQICTANSHRVLAELTKKSEYMKIAQGALEQILDVLDPEAHTYMRARLKLQIGELYSRSPSFPMSSENEQLARSSCSQALEVFRELSLDWLAKGAEIYLENLSLTRQQPLKS